jgi:protein-tyrosine phosphatase
MHDCPKANIREIFEEAHSFIDGHRQNGNVYVHCYAGISRSATCVITYLMRIFSWDFKKSYHYVKSRRNSINPNPGFVKIMKEYEKEL